MIFADNTYSKPFFVTYFNTSFFILPLFTIFFSRLWALWRSKKLRQIDSFRSLLRHLDSRDDRTEEQSIRHAAGFDEEVYGDDGAESSRYLRSVRDDSNSKLGLRATAKLSFQFCLLWVRPALPAEGDNG